MVLNSCNNPAFLTSSGVFIVPAGGSRAVTRKQNSGFLKTGKTTCAALVRCPCFWQPDYEVLAFCLADRTLPVFSQRLR